MVSRGRRTRSGRVPSFLTRTLGDLSPQMQPPAGPADSVGLNRVLSPQISRALSMRGLFFGRDGGRLREGLEVPVPGRAALAVTQQADEEPIA